MPEIVTTILSSTILLVATLVIYFLSFNIGFGPIKHTLVSEMFTTEEQVFILIFHKPLIGQINVVEHQA